MALTPGTRLGPYEIVSAIGAGGMGEVYRATDSNLKRSVAIKVLPASVAGDADRLARFQREAEVLAVLNHPNIGAIYGLEKTADFTGLVMELVEGEDLSQRIAKGAIPLEEALRIAKQIAEALAAAHEQGIIHRDLKPANTKVKDDGIVKVFDFGLAKAMESNDPSRLATGADLTQSPTITTPAGRTGIGMILGTAAYMSPEQAKGRPVDRRSDIWAFGCVLFEMLAGKPAFAGETLTDVLATIVKDEVMAHADETDDSHAPSVWHPGCAVVPAALATGERFAIDGQHFLRSVALGYDIGSRVMATLRAAGPKRYKSSHSIAGVFGAAAAAGCVASLSPQQMRWLLDYTAQQSSGIAAWSRDVDHIEKGFAFGGMPARSGVTSALLVRAGWNGIDDIFSGENNFLLANAPEADPTHLPTELLAEQLGDRYEVLRTNIKKWTVGSPIQAPLDALEILLQRQRFSADQVKEMLVRVSEGDVVDNRDMPDIDLQHMMTVMLVDGTASFASAHDKARMKDAAIVRHRAKVRLIPNDPQIVGRQAIVEVTLVDGTRLTEFVKAVRGTAENPMTRDEVVEKCRDLITPILGGAGWSRLSERVLNLERAGSVAELSGLLRRA